VTDAEFVRVQCYVNNSDQPLYSNFHALARLKPDVERRCDEVLDQRRGRGDPLLNVLMIGIDSTSRLNSIRRLNSTRRFLLQQLHVNRLLYFMSSVVCPSSSSSYPPSERSETGGYTVFTFVCMSVCLCASLLLGLLQGGCHI